MNQEELKTCLGQLLLDLRGNWAYSYTDRIKTALGLCSQIEDWTEDIVQTGNEELEDGDYDGRCFRDCSFYGYFSEEGDTEEVRNWLKVNLSHPEHCELILETCDYCDFEINTAGVCTNMHCSTNENL